MKEIYIISNLKRDIIVVLISTVNKVILFVGLIILVVDCNSITVKLCICYCDRILKFISVESLWCVFLNFSKKPYYMFSLNFPKCQENILKFNFLRKNWVGHVRVVRRGCKTIRLMLCGWGADGGSWVWGSVLKEKGDPKCSRI